MLKKLYKYDVKVDEIIIDLCVFLSNYVIKVETA